jgi:hypothetical protein
MSRWLTEGRTLGESLRRFNCIVVAGPDSDATASVALGIAEVQAAERHVVLGDLLDDAKRFSSFQAGDDHHGLVEVVHYGTSLGRVTRPVTNVGGLVFAQTGSHIADYDELLSHPRWARVIGPFMGSNDLLVLALSLNASGIEQLVQHADGMVLVDGVAPAKIDPARIIARIQAPPRPTIAPAGAAAVAAAPGVPRDRPPTAAVNLQPGVRQSTAVPRPKEQPAQRKSTSVASPVKRAVVPAAAAGKPIPGLNRTVVVGALLSLSAALFVYWVAERQTSVSEPPTKVVTPSAVGVLQPAPPKPRPRPADPNVIDPGDSGAAAYAVQLSSANTQSGAILTLQRNSGVLPAATFAEITIGGTLWYKVITGAYLTRGGADSLLASLRESKVIDSTLGIVVRVPYAIRIDSIKASGSVRDALASLSIGRRVPAYALQQKSGWVWVLVGAFETASQADAYAETLRAVDMTPQIVLRKGRMF